MVRFLIEPLVLVAQRGDDVGELIDAFGALEQQGLELSDVTLLVAEFVAQLDDDCAQFVDISFKLGDVGAGFPAKQIRHTPQASTPRSSHYPKALQAFTKIFMHFSKTSGQLGDDLTRTSDINPVFSPSAAGEPAFSFCAGDGGRKRRAVQRHVSHGYLVYPSAGHWRASACSCGD